jgi:mannose-6-phosphate isomerase-like protein (cupin superfamily)
MNDAAEPGAVGFCTRQGSGAALPAAGGEVLAEGCVTAGRLTVIHSETPAGDEVPLHVHHDVDECFYVLAGHYRVTCGPDVFHADAGSLVFLPRRVPHSYTVGEQPGRKLIIGVPAGLEALYRDMDDEAVDLDRLQHRHGITFL